MQQANKSLELPTTGVQPHLMIREEFSTRPGQRPAPPRQALKFLDFQPKLTHPRPRSGPCRPANQAPCDTDTIRPVAFPRGAPTTPNCGNRRNPGECPFTTPCGQGESI